MLTLDDMCRIVAVYRFILPDASIRLAGERGLMPGHGEKCFVSGAESIYDSDAGYVKKRHQNYCHRISQR